jgi:hypothetical protein
MWWDQHGYYALLNTRWSADFFIFQWCAFFYSLHFGRRLQYLCFALWRKYRLELQWITKLITYDFYFCCSISPWIKFCFNLGIQKRYVQLWWMKCIRKLISRTVMNNSQLVICLNSCQASSKVITIDYSNFLGYKNKSLSSAYTRVFRKPPLRHRVESIHFQVIALPRPSSET